MPSSVVMVLDSPFLFLVRERTSGAIAFISWVDDPITRDAGTPGDVVPHGVARWLRSEGVHVPMSATQFP